MVPGFLDPYKMIQRSTIKNQEEKTTIKISNKKIGHKVHLLLNPWNKLTHKNRNMIKKKKWIVRDETTKLQVTHHRWF